MLQILIGITDKMMERMFELSLKHVKHLPPGTLTAHANTKVEKNILDGK